MSNKLQFQSAVLTTVRYSMLFSYPLTTEEIEHWLPISSSKKNLRSQLTVLVKEKKLKKDSIYYSLPDKRSLITVRQKRKAISTDKWKIASLTSKKLFRLPWIKTVAATGSLAMNNCDEGADIDLMLICLPNTLWLTRLITWLLLFPNRRSPAASTPNQIKDKICDNVYLETNSLDLKPKNRATGKSFYLAHEILQAKPLLDRDQAFKLFLVKNRWVIDIFPQALPADHQVSDISKSNFNFFSLFLFFPNLFAFFAQYLFMKPKITGETITLHRALFHPQPPSLVARFTPFKASWL